MSSRPLSPHLFHYRFAYTMALSISHRFTGLVLSIGLIVLCSWLESAARGAEAYASTLAVLSHWAFKVLLVGWLASFLFHFCNGIRHLLWDTGVGLERPAARRGAAIVLVVAALALIACLWLFFSGHGAQP
jgi:succinate dehydrogenase / fumarate reductase cytochrome b subunit